MSAVSLSQGTKAVTAAGTPVALVAAPQLVASVEIFARKNKTTANTGDVYVGIQSGAGNQNRTLAPGASITIKAPEGKKLDLAGIYIDAATNADAVIWTAVGLT